mmetsp:Transcript_26611/g.106618  ORF Transcript_26611/g.106618 Transcript_26611/m.106618 type:complete len:276 (+) Transcript_26611:91-918(+)
MRNQGACSSHNVGMYTSIHREDDLPRCLACLERLDRGVYVVQRHSQADAWRDLAASPELDDLATRPLEDGRLVFRVGAPEEPQDRDVLDKQHVRRHRRDASTRREADGDGAARAEVEFAHDRIEERRADHVYGDVDAAERGRGDFELGPELGRRGLVIQRRVVRNPRDGALGAREVEFRFVRSRRDDPRPKQRRELHGGEPDAPRGRRHQHRLARLDLRALGQRHVRRAVRYRERRGAREILFIHTKRPRSTTTKRHDGALVIEDAVRRPGAAAR